MRGFPRPDPKKKIVWQTIGQAKQPSAGQKMKAGKREIAPIAAGGWTERDGSGPEPGLAKTGS